MTAIKFNGHFEINYEGWNYVFETDKIVKVEDDVLAFLTERVPMSFEPVDGKEAEKAPKVTRTKVVPFIRTTRGVFGGELPNRNMAVFGRPNHAVPVNPDVTPPSGTIDSDGVQWYGEGVVKER